MQIKIFPLAHSLCSNLVAHRQTFAPIILIFLYSICLVIHILQTIVRARCNFDLTGLRMQVSSLRKCFFCSTKLLQGFSYNNYKYTFSLKKFLSFLNSINKSYTDKEWLMTLGGNMKYYIIRSNILQHYIVLT